MQITFYQLRYIKIATENIDIPLILNSVKMSRDSCCDTICRKRHYMSQKTPLYVANATICRNMQHYMLQTPLYVAKNATICRKV